MKQKYEDIKWNERGLGCKRDRLAVVILNWNGEKVLRSFLPSVCRYSHLDGVSIWVADNASSDASCEVLEKEFPYVQLIRLNRNYGFAQGYNKALSKIESDYYLLLNSDVEVTENWLDPLLEYMDAHPEVAACQPKLLSWHHKDQFEYAGACGGYLDKLGYPYCRGRIFDTVEEDKGQYDAIVPVFWATGAAFMVRSDDYWAYGGLDGTFFAHMEEIDFCWRLRHAGRQIVCVPQSKVYHVGGGTLHKENPRKTYLNFRNNLFMLYKNLPSNQLVFILCLRALLDYVAVLTFLFKGHVPDAKAVLKARWDFWRMHSYCREARKNVWSYVRVKQIPEQKPASILWSYYMKGIRYFSML